VDDVSDTTRFSPRMSKSIWSRVNIKRVGELTALGWMAPPGVKAFEQRDERRTARYSYEHRPRSFEGEYEKAFKADRNAWAFFASQAPSYQRTATWWAMSAVEEETRIKRLAALIAASGDGRRLGVIEGKPGGAGKKA
jgi:uncharacterized protein YdeI (YjbR/CyaY-like superfamily)